MHALLTHLALRNPRFRCRDVSKEHHLTVNLSSSAGKPATPRELDALRAIAGAQYALLEPLYRHFNGLALHGHRDTFGLVVAPIEQLAEFASDWKDSFYVDEPDLYPFQRRGIAFATIANSGNYFAAHDGKIYYDDHDGGDDTVWGNDLESFFERAVREPAKFLYDAGCYTRYFDGKTDRQFLPEEFLHD
jgi:hypothetical protein